MYCSFFAIFRVKQRLGYSSAVRKTHGDIFVRNCKEPPYSVVIFDDDYNLKSAMTILKKLELSERIYICKSSWQNRERLPRENPKSFILFGNCSDFLNRNIAAPCVLIMPPPHMRYNGEKYQKFICQNGIPNTINYAKTSQKKK